ncbi:MAG: tetratricopeptide repeat protein [Verrucomicrobiota bacterium]|nr:tetratricopeptide repeat protein [Verrucomicrobiota bacterium]
MSEVSVPPPRPDKIFTIAVGLVALFGAIELAAVGFHFALRARSARALTTPSVTTSQRAATPAQAAASPAAVAAPPASTSGAQSTPSAAALSAADRLLKEATMLRDHGDTTNALARLQEAAQRDPKNANVLAEMAMIYESVQSFDRSNESWRKIQEIGPSAGALYELADMKLKMGVPAPAGATASAAGPGLAGVSPLDAGATRDDSDGIPDGSTFGVVEATPTENPDPDAETNLTLRIAVKARPNTVIDHTKVKIQVFFYDTLDNKDVVLTDADVSYEWVTAHHDWKGTNPEVLAVTYVRAKNKGVSPDAALSAAAAAVTPSAKSKKSSSKRGSDSATTKDGSDGHRKYLGYIVRVYYNDQLQSVRADPTKLLNLFPPPFTAPSS